MPTEIVTPPKAAATDNTLLYVGALVGGLDVQDRITIILSSLDSISSEVVSIGTTVDGVVTLLSSPTYGLSALNDQLTSIGGDVVGIQSDLSNGTYGLAAIKGAVDDLAGTTNDWDRLLADHLVNGSFGQAIGLLLTRVGTPASYGFTDSSVAGGIKDVHDLLTTVSGDVTAMALVVDTINTNVGTIMGWDLSGTAQNVADILAWDLTGASERIANIHTWMGDATGYGFTDNTVSGGVSDVLGKIGEPVGASISADIAAVKSAVDTLSPDPTAVKASKSSGSLAQGASEVVDLGTGDGFDCFNADIRQVIVKRTGASSNYTVQIYEKSNCTADDLIAEWEAVDMDMNVSTMLNFNNNDTSPVKHLYIKVINNTDAGSTTFAVSVRGIRLAQALA